MRHYLKAAARTHVACKLEAEENEEINDFIGKNGGYTCKIT